MESSRFVNESEKEIASLKEECGGRFYSDLIDEAKHQYVDLVMEGGGVLGVALVGYTYALEQIGIRFLSVGGTSAGAINAMLIASAGPPWDAKSEKIVPLLANLNCRPFVDGGEHIQRFVDLWIKEGVNLTLLTEIPWVFHNIGKGLGLNPGTEFLNWMSGVLQGFNIRTYHDLQKRMNQRPDGFGRRGREQLSDAQAHARLALVATEAVTETKVDLPRMAGLFWSNPDDLDPALFVRASMSVPYFFEPFVVAPIPNGPAAVRSWSELAGFDEKIPDSCVIVDGGMMSNFPIELFHLPKAVPAAPTFGVKLGIEERHNDVGTPVALGRAIFNSARHCLDYDFLRQNPDYRHLVAQIDTGKHQWLNFELTDDDKLDLFLRGVQAAGKFLRGFNWGPYKEIRADLARTYS
jgi:NTE family protein